MFKIWGKILSLSEGIGISNISRVLSFSQLASQIITMNQLQEEVLEWLLEDFGCNSGAIFLYKEDDTLDFLDSPVSGLSRDVIKRYLEYFRPLDPTRTELMPEPLVVTTEDFISINQLKATDYYRSFLRSISILYEMHIRLRFGSDQIGLACLYRSPNQEPFSKEDQTRAALIAPHITNALHTAIVSERLKIYEILSNSLIAQMPCQALLVLNHNIEPVFISKSFYEVFCNWQERPSEAVFKNSIMLQDLLEYCRSNIEILEKKSEKPFRTIELSKDMGRNRLSINILRIDQGNNPPFYMISLIPHESFLIFSDQLRILGLTKREQQIVSLLILGLKNHEIAKRLSISELTVENHLRAIYQKLDVGNRTSAIQRILSLISPMSWPILQKADDNFVSETLSST
jgi:DNA-binding CsgD family transcriptional regulator